MISLDEFLGKVRRETDAALDLIIPQSDAEPRRLHEAMRWSVFAGGKRLRPAILFAAGMTFGASESELASTAAAIEMVHTYSLIHDDLPAMDDDDLRRGKAACHKQFGEATAILAGDCLQTLAFKAISADESLASDTRLRLISLLADAAGTPAGMVSGQQLDLDAEGKTLSIEDIETIHRQKTGALISAAAVSGAIIGGASDTELASIKQFAEKLGLLFQITDDILDVTEETATLGKTAGKDAAVEKATYPSHYGIERAKDLSRILRDDASSALSGIGKDTTTLLLLADLIGARTA